jgi:hypothetical protein
MDGDPSRHSRFFTTSSRRAGSPPPDSAAGNSTDHIHDLYDKNHPYRELFILLSKQDYEV